MHSCPCEHVLLKMRHTLKSFSLCIGNCYTNYIYITTSAIQNWFCVAKIYHFSPNISDPALRCIHCFGKPTHLQTEFPMLTSTRKSSRRLNVASVSLSFGSISTSLREYLRKAQNFSRPYSCPVSKNECVNFLSTINTICHHFLQGKAYFLVVVLIF